MKKIANSRSLEDLKMEYLKEYPRHTKEYVDKCCEELKEAGFMCDDGITKMGEDCLRMLKIDRLISRFFYAPILKVATFFGWKPSIK